MEPTQQTPPTAAEPRGVQRSIWPRAMIIAGGIVITAVLLTRDRAAEEDAPPLPLIAKVPEFSLIGRDGRMVTLENLAGHVWVADFIFTRCAGPCPELSLRMRSLQQGTAEFGGAVKLVSFSVDPTYDQPAVLRKYADRFQSDPNLWWFLTCNDERMMYDFVQKGFLQALSAAQGGSPIIHSTRFVLVDRQGHIRAWYDGLDAASKPLILRDARRLLAESSSS